MRCPKCNYNNEADATFCAQCGYKLPENNSDMVNTKNPQDIYKESVTRIKTNLKEITSELKTLSSVTSEKLKKEINITKKSLKKQDILIISRQILFVFIVIVSVATIVPFTILGFTTGTTQFFILVAVFAFFILIPLLIVYRVLYDELLTTYSLGYFSLSLFLGVFSLNLLTEGRFSFKVIFVGSIFLIATVAFFLQNTVIYDFNLEHETEVTDSEM